MFASVIHRRVWSGRVFVLLMAGLASLSVSAGGHTSAPSVDLSLEQQLDLFLDWFPGEYDNHEQNWQDNLSQVEQVHERIHHIFYPATAMQVGEHTFFVQQYLDGDRGNVYRQRLYSFSIDEAEGALRLDIYSFLDEPKYRDAFLNPEILATLDKSELVARPGCEVYWEFAGDHFHGYMKDRACKVMSRSTGQPIYITDDLRLTPDEIWIRDEAFDAAGKRVFGNRAGIHHKNRKVQYYTGWAGVGSAGPELAVAEGSWSTADGAWAFTGDLDNFSRFVIHNEGEIVPILNADGKPSGYSVQLAKLTYQNTVIPILTLKLWEDATRRVLTYSWAATDSERIGLNARWAQIGLTVAPGSPSFGFEIEAAPAP